MLVVLKTEGEVQEKAIEEIYGKMKVLENGMKDFFPNGKPCVDINNVGLLDVVFCSLFGGYKFHEQVLGWYYYHRSREVPSVILLGDRFY